MNRASPVVQDLVLVGGGHSHVAVLKRFGMAPLPGVRVTLISNVEAAPYSGMLPGCIAGHYRREESQIELRPLCGFAGAQFYRDTVTGLDLEHKRVLFATRPPAAFDLLSINIGSTPQMLGIPGAAKHALAVKPVQRFLQRWEEFFGPQAMKDSARRRLVVVGGGAGGVELLLAVRHRLLEGAFGSQPGQGQAWEFHLVTASGTVLPSHNRSVQKRYQRVLSERGVRVHLNQRVVEVGPHQLFSEGGGTVPYDVLLWVTHAAAPAWLRSSGLGTDDEGFVTVDDFLRSTSHPFVFAAGDVAAMANHPRPKSGVFAVRQGRPLADNLRSALAGEPLRRFVPQRQFLSLISTGDRYAVASRGPFACEGSWVWRLKDWIDRRWMRGYQELRPMGAGDANHARAVPPALEPSRQAQGEPGAAGRAGRPQGARGAARCGGCGAKVGPEVLRRVLRRLDPVQRDDVLVGLNTPDDAAVIRVPPGMVMVQTVDFFRTFLGDPYVFGQVTANHCLGDIFAMGADPQSALAVVTVPYGVEAAVEEQLYQLLAGALQVLNAHGTQLAGGHTAEGPELAFGLVVSGFGDPDQLWRKGGLQPGDALVLTKPIGTGTLFAADMRGQTRGEWIQAALDSMRLSNRSAARIFRSHQATACTDVTGFGLLGHLLEMLKASNVTASVRLADVPLLDGAHDTSQRGILSSLHPQNLFLRQSIANPEAAAGLEHFALLFDPQTAGGLLAGVPPDRVRQCLDALLQAGYPHAAVIGGVSPPSQSPAVVTVLP